MADEPGRAGRADDADLDDGGWVPSGWAQWRLTAGADQGADEGAGAAGPGADAAAEEGIDVTRIVAGQAGGRRLVVPKGDTTRPTTDRVREALFSTLDSRGVLQGASVLDLYAGSGALGLEAASRGAASVVLVDTSRQAVEAARANVAALGFPRVAVVLSSVQRYLAQRPVTASSLVFADPPYAMGQDEITAMLAALTDRQWLPAAGMVLVERSSRSLEPRWPDGLVRRAVRRYGETAVWEAEWQPARH